MKLINSQGYETMLPTLGIVIGDKQPVEVPDDIALEVMQREPTLRVLDEAPLSISKKPKKGDNE